MSKISFCCIFIAFVMFLMPATVQAQSKAAATIAIVDMDKILSESLAGKSIQSQLKKKREAFQQEFAQRENNLVDSEKKLIQDKASLTPEAFEVKRKDFEKQLLETRNLFQKRRNILDRAVNKALSILRENVMKVTAQIAEQEKVALVLTRDSVVIMDKNLDITDKVLSKMNASTKTIPLILSE